MRLPSMHSKLAKRAWWHLALALVVCLLAVGSAGWVVFDAIRPREPADPALFANHTPIWGSTASDFTLESLRGGNPVRLANLLHEKPVVLVLSSFT